MPLTLESLTGGPPRPVAIADLETELSALWRSAADGHESAVTRACAFTLLVYVESEEAARELGPVVADLTRQNPCRAILMVMEPGAGPADLRAAISAHCHLPVGGEKQVCCEQVTVCARGEASRDLPYVILPLIVSDLPTYFWWRAGRFAPSVSLDPILRVSSRVIVDSARFSEPEADLRSLSEKAAEIAAQGVWLTDLNWTRIIPWRELIAQCFDAPERRAALENLGEVRIEFERESVRRAAQEVQSLLLTGWLASRLGWQPKGESRVEGGARAFNFERTGGQVRVRCAGRDCAGSGVCFHIQLRSGEPPSTFTLDRGEDGRSVETRAELAGQQPISRAVRLPVTDESELAGQELTFSGRDHVYEEALRMVARMTA